MAAPFSGTGRSKTAVRSWWRDPFFYFGLLFIGYLILQRWNTGRVQFYDVGLNQWTLSPSPHPGWPSSFDRVEASQMIHWFVPAWVLALAVRSPQIGRRSLTHLLLGLTYSAGLLALFGIIQFLSQTRSHYWLSPMDEGFFASFGYTNHAAAYFVLTGALAAGFLFRELLHPARSPKKTRMGLLAATLLLCLTGANLSLSRAGVILAWGLAVFIAGYGIIRGWTRLSKAGRVNLAMATLAILCVFYFAVAGFGSRAISNEFRVKKPVHHVLFPVLNEVNLGLEDRPLLAGTALRIWQDHKWLGVGGWGFRYLLSSYVPSEQWEWVQKPGRANVHCDPLQFLLEFGIAGFALMSAAGLTLIVALFRNTNRRQPMWVMGVIGLGLVVVFSLIDLPFRCPALLCTWIVTLAALPKLTTPSHP
jgi:hypothetical protein